jgi:hypothetical protein
VYEGGVFGRFHLENMRKHPKKCPKFDTQIEASPRIFLGQTIDMIDVR